MNIAFFENDKDTDPIYNELKEFYLEYYGDTPNDSPFKSPNNYNQKLKAILEGKTIENLWKLYRWYMRKCETIKFWNNYPNLDQIHHQILLKIAEVTKNPDEIWEIRDGMYESQFSSGRNNGGRGYNDIHNEKKLYQDLLLKMYIDLKCTESNHKRRR